MNTFPLKIILCTCFALLAFAGNSVLCRLALGEHSIDAASFTVIRLLSGIAILLAIVYFRHPNVQPTAKGSWSAALMLFLYAVTFSFAYISLDTGTGALILFGTVQITMILVSMLSGNRLHVSEWLGVLLAFSGFVYLILPSLTTPSLTGFILMMSAGIAWGIYTLKGRGSVNPINDTAFNFARTLPFILILGAVFYRDVDISQQGVLLAMVSGALASGLGYAVWYTALGGLSATQAAVIQLLVPVIAAIGGVVFANEMISLRLILSSMMVLGGIMLVILTRYYLQQAALRQATDT